MLTGQEGSNQEVVGTPDSISLPEAVRRTDPTFFGPIFDNHFQQLVDGKLPYEERSRRAFDLTLRDKIIQRCGIGAVVNAAKDEKWSGKYLSTEARNTLNRFIEEQKNLQKGTSK